MPEYTAPGKTSEGDPVVGAINGIIKADGAGNILAAVANGDYQAVLSEGAFANGDKTKLNGIAASATANAGTVTSVATSAPITGGTITGTGTIGISAATTSAAGSMSSADKTKLDGIASSATANAGTVTSIATSAPITGGTITGSGTIGISAATTSAAGSMSSADKTKLDGIEASADVTDATNVTAAGALMDSECASLADVKALNQSVVSGASPNFTTTNMTDASNKRFMTDTQEAKLDALASPFQHLRLNLTNNGLAEQSAGTAYYLDLANTSNYTSTGNTTDIVVTNATQDYIELGAGGMYMVVASVELFTASGTAAQDFWLNLGNGTSSDAERRRWGTARFKVKEVSSASDCAINMQKTVIIDVASGGSDEKLYVIPQVNAVNFTVKAYDANRTNITVTRIGASTS